MSYFRSEIFYSLLDYYDSFRLYVTSFSQWLLHTREPLDEGFYDMKTRRLITWDCDS